MKEHFIKELRQLLNLTCAQGGQVEKLLHQAIEAICHVDTELATNVISQDPVIDHEEIHIEEECLKVLALYQPVATDLRTIVAILKINTALERMADFGVHIAERVPEIAPYINSPTLEKIDFTAMEHATLSMLRGSLESMRHSDPVLAYSIIEQDDAVDQAHRDNVMRAHEGVSRFPDQSGYYLACIGISLALERIADMASHICEHVIYLETGKIIRHRA